MQRSVDDAQPGVELSARTRAPASTHTDGSPSPAGRPAPAVNRLDDGLDPAPPLTARLRAVRDEPADAHRSTAAVAAPDDRPAQRYQPQWQGDTTDEVRRSLATAPLRSPATRDTAAGEIVTPTVLRSTDQPASAPTARHVDTHAPAALGHAAPPKAAPDHGRTVGLGDGVAVERLTPAPPAVRRTELDPRGADIGRSAIVAAGDNGATPADAPVRRFESVLRRAPAAPAPLPVKWRPLASAIAGQRRVRVSTNAASRAALQAVGKVAATTGDVIHLARPLTGPGDASLLAHELTHVASPSPAPRFFDDDRDSPEERRAEMIADVIRRSPVLPRATARADSPDLPVSRAPATSRATARRGGSTSTSADELVRRLAGGSQPAAAAGTIRRAIEGPTRAAAAPRRRRHAPSPSPTAWLLGNAPGSSGTAPSSSSGGPSVAGSPSMPANPASSSGEAGATPSTARGSRSWPLMTGDLNSSTMRDLADWIVEQVEARVIRELERRGGRYRGEF